MGIRAVYVCALMLGVSYATAAANPPLQTTAPTTQIESRIEHIKQQAVALLESDRPAEAYELLRESLSAQGDDVELLFLAGMAAQEIDRPHDAIRHFRAALELQPDLPRVRLELANAYSAAGKRFAARSEFHRVLEASPPVTVRANIEQYMAALEQQKNWHVRLSGGYLYDDNVNAGPETDTVPFFGIPFILSRDARQRSDSAIVTGAAADHILPLTDEVALRSSFMFDSVTYFEASDFNVEEFGLLMGPQFQDGRFIVGIPLALNYSRVGSERYGLAMGVAPEIRYALTEQMSLRTSLLAQATEYWQRPEREGSIWSAEIAARHLIGATSFVELGYRHTWENADASFLDNDLDAIYAGFYKPLPWKIDIYVRPMIAWNRFDAREEAFDEARDDTRFTLDVNLSRPIGDGSFVVHFDYTYTRADSNLPLFELERHQVSVQLSKEF